MNTSKVDEHKIKADLPGTSKDMGPPYGKRDPYYSHIFRDSYENPTDKIDISRTHHGYLGHLDDPSICFASEPGLEYLT